MLQELKDAGSISDGVIRISNWNYPSGRTMVLGSTKTLTEINTRNISCVGKGGLCLGLTTLKYSCADFLYTPAGTTSWSLEGLSRLVMDLLSRNMNLHRRIILSDNFASILPLNFAWRQETQRSPLFQTQVSRVLQLTLRFYSPCRRASLEIFAFGLQTCVTSNGQAVGCTAKWQWSNKIMVRIRFAFPLSQIRACATA